MSNTTKSTKYVLVTADGETEFSSKKIAVSKGEASGVFFHVLSPAGKIVHEHAAPEVPEDEDLLGTVDSPETDDTTEEAGSQEDAVEEDDRVFETVLASEVEIGQFVKTWRKGHPALEVGRIRLGRKHVTLYTNDDVDIHWVPLADGTVEVLVD